MEFGFFESLDEEITKLIALFMYLVLVLAIVCAILAGFIFCLFRRLSKKIPKDFQKTVVKRGIDLVDQDWRPVLWEKLVEQETKDQELLADTVQRLTVAKNEIDNLYDQPDDFWNFHEEKEGTKMWYKKVPGLPSIWKCETYMEHSTVDLMLAFVKKEYREYWDDVTIDLLHEWGDMSVFIQEARMKAIPRQFINASGVVQNSENVSTQYTTFTELPTHPEGKWVVRAKSLKLASRTWQKEGEKTKIQSIAQVQIGGWVPKSILEFLVPKIAAKNYADIDAFLSSDAYKG